MKKETGVSIETLLTLLSRRLGNCTQTDTFGPELEETVSALDAIIITCAATHIPPLLLKQLKIGGKLIMPLGDTFFTQDLTLVIKKESGNEVTSITGVVFVPMTGDAQH
jgi:protein-L-isoaspartate O-methyltransferase